MLTRDQIEQFHEDGYLAVDRLLDYELDIEPVINEYQQLLDDLCEQWVAEGRLEQTFSELPFEKRLVEVYRAGCEYYQAFDIALPNGNIRADTPIHLGPAVFDLLRSPRLLSAVESLIGGEIYSNPIQHVRIKPPASVVNPEDAHSALISATHWHQDNGVALPEADETKMLTCWVAVSEATPENGCLQVAPKSHREGIALHCTIDNQLGIPDNFIEQEQARPIPLNPGGVLFFHPMCKHGSLDNNSDAFRWSFDLRYNPIGQATGRPHFPGFIAQSRANPESELADHREWAKLWLEARSNLAEVTEIKHNRWNKDDPLCA
ncbi:MAG: phytanoyl-CoA dioxygenase family protein [Chloroflexota bacterium]|nr:phytanoyl-CoA dioxygenase family protein [Chloroflexota bacterium]MDE2910179.1 phytanoyl-CoA dioxygenase family protein [Chloroflexota bacterium]